jgi:hypothetical protein
MTMRRWTARSTGVEESLSVHASSTAVVPSLLHPTRRLLDGRLNGSGHARAADLPPHDLAMGHRVHVVRVELHLRRCLGGVIGPSIAAGTFGAATWGTALSARAAGVLAMSIAMYRLTVRAPLVFGRIAFALTCPPLIAIGFHARIPLLILSAAIGGLGSGALAVAWETALQHGVPERALSRVASHDDLGSFAALPLGQIAAGPAAGSLGAAGVSIIGGFVNPLMSLLPLASTSIRSFRT